MRRRRGGVRRQRVLQHAPEPLRWRPRKTTIIVLAAATVVRAAVAAAGPTDGRRPTTTAAAGRGARRRPLSARHQTGGVRQPVRLRRPRRHVAVRRRRVFHVPLGVATAAAAAATRPTPTTPPAPAAPQSPSPPTPATSPSPPVAAATATAAAALRWPAKRRRPTETLRRRHVVRPDGRAHIQVDASQA